MPTGGAGRKGSVAAGARRAPHERMRGVTRRASAPPLRPGLVDRPVLIDGLLGATHAPVVLVSAPAGYGKTTLLSQWQQRDDRTFGWLTLEHADNDPVVLLGAVITVLTDVLDLDPALVDELAVPEPAFEERILPSVVDACARSLNRGVLVLDDLHMVTEARCHTALDYMAQRLPSNCQLAWATRTDPAVQLARIRAHGRLWEVRAADLALGDQEAGAVLATSGITLAPERLSQLVERTEGWPAAVYLAALSMRGSPDPDAYGKRFAGTSRHVPDLLSQEGLSRPPAAVI